MIINHKGFSLIHRIVILGLLVSLASCAKTYTITFDSNGGSSTENQVVSEGELANRPGNPTKSRHDFRFWSESLSQSQGFDFSTPITRDIKLYAIYVPWVKPTLSQVNSSFDITLNAEASIVGTNSNYYVKVEFTFTLINVSNKNYSDFDLVVDYLWIMENDYEYSGQIFEDLTLLDVYGERNLTSTYEITKSGYRPKYFWSTYYNFDVEFDVVAVR